MSLVVLSQRNQHILSTLKQSLQVYISSNNIGIYNSLLARLTQCAEKYNPMMFPFNASTVSTSWPLFFRIFPFIISQNSFLRHGKPFPSKSSMRQAYPSAFIVLPVSPSKRTSLGIPCTLNLLQTFNCN